MTLEEVLGDEMFNDKKISYNEHTIEINSIGCYVVRQASTNFIIFESSSDWSIEKVKQFIDKQNETTKRLRGC